MRVKEVRVERLRNCGDYNNLRAGVTIRLEKGDDHELAFEAAKLIVDSELGLRPDRDPDVIEAERSNLESGRKHLLKLEYEDELLDALKVNDDD